MKSKAIHKANVILWMLLLLGFTACTEETDTPRSAAGKGHLSFSQIEIDVNILNTPLTKGMTSSYNAPSADELTYTITPTGSTTGAVYSYSELLASPVLTEGSYTLTATYGDNQMGTTPYLYYTTTFTIQALQTTTLPSISIPLACAIIRPSVDDLLPHFQNDVQITLSDETGNSLDVTNLTDYYVPTGKSYTLRFSGTNQLGETKTIQGSISQAASRTRYILNCTADLPVFTLPEQPDYNAWSYHIDFIPMTESNISYTAGMEASKILNNLTYEYTTDGGATWHTFTGTKLTGLTPSTTYTFRARFGAVQSSNQVSLTTEGAEPVPNGDMDTWSESSYSTYGKQKIYKYFCGLSSTDKKWGTNNELTMNGVSGGTSTGTSNQIVAYRWNSCTIPTSDTNSGSGKAAEIRTMAFANFSIKNGTGVFASRSSMASDVLKNCNVYIGYLYLGISDMTQANSIPNKYEVLHSSRPKYFTFSYKYSPINSDSFIVKAELYSIDKEMIASTSYSLGTNQSTYATQSLPFIYTNLQKKAGYLFIQFQSGSRTSVNDVKHITGDYIWNPWSLDTFIGSTLKVDDISLIYD